jgi:hypothetical protein
MESIMTLAGTRKDEIVPCGLVVFANCSWPLVEKMLTKEQIAKAMADHPDWEAVDEDWCGKQSLGIYRPSSSGGWVPVANILPITR